MKAIFTGIVISLLFVHSFTGCTKNNLPVEPEPFPVMPVPELPTPGDSTHRTFLALGDSYTIGQSVEEQLRFPAQTVALLNKKGGHFHEPLYIARTGWTTRNLQSAMDHATLAENYDIVTLLIGVNDQYQGIDTATYRARFTELLKRSIGLAGNNPLHVFVVSIPDYSATPFVEPAYKQTVSLEIDWFNDINKNVSDLYHCVYVDITPSSRDALNDASLVAGDGLHPSGSEYKKWAVKLSSLIELSFR